MARLRKTTTIQEIANYFGGTANRDASGKVRSVTIGNVRYTETGTYSLQALRNEYAFRTGVGTTQSLEKSVANKVIAQTKTNTVNFRTWDKELRKEYLKLKRALNKKNRGGETSVEQINRKLGFESREDLLSQIKNKSRHTLGIAYVGNVEALISKIRSFLIYYGYEEEELVNAIIDRLDSNKENILDSVIVECNNILYELVNNPPVSVYVMTMMTLHAYVFSNVG